MWDTKSMALVEQSKGLEKNRREKYMLSLSFQHTYCLLCQALLLVRVYSSDQKGQIPLPLRSLLGAYYGN